VDAAEEVCVGSLNDGDSLLGEAATRVGNGESFDAGVSGIRCTGEQAARFQRTHDLTGHHHVDLGVVGDLALAGQLAGGDGLVGQPPDGGKQYELHMGQLEGAQGSGDAALPAQGGAPQ
jgi:hypothetical protein